MINVQHQYCLVSDAVVVSAKVSKDKYHRQQEQQVQVMKRRQKTVRFTHHHHLRQQFANQTTEHLLNLNQEEDEKTDEKQTPTMCKTRPVSQQQILKMMTLLVAAHLALISAATVAAAAGNSLPAIRAAHLSGDVASSRNSPADAGAQLQHQHHRQQSLAPPKQRVSSHNDLLNQHHQQLARVIAMMSDVSDAEATTADKLVVSQQAPSPPPQLERQRQVNQKQQQQQVEQQVNQRQVNQQQRSTLTASQQKLMQTDNGHPVGTKSAAARLSSTQNLATGSVQVSNAPGARFARLETQDQTNSDDQSGFDVNAEAPVSVAHSHQSAGAQGYNHFQSPNQHLRLQQQQQQQQQQQHKLRLEPSAAAEQRAVAAAQQEQFARQSSPAEPAGELSQSYSSQPEERLVDEAADFAAQVGNREKARTANIKVVFNNNPRFIIGAGNHPEASMNHQDYVPLLRRTRQPAAHLYNDDYYLDASSVNETSIRAPANLEEPPCDRKEKAAAAALKAAAEVDSASVELVEPNAQSLAPKSPRPPPPPPSPSVQSGVPAKRQLSDKLTGSSQDEQQQVVDTPLEQIVRSGLRPPLRMVISMRNKHGELMKVPVNLHGSMPGTGEAPMQLHLEQVDERKLSAKQVKADSSGGNDSDDLTPPGGDFFDPSFSKPFVKQFNRHLSGNNRLQVTPKPDCAGKENEEPLGAGAGESMSGNANLQFPSLMSPFNQNNKTLASMFELLSRQMLSSLSQQVSQQQQVPAQMSQQQQQQQVAQQFSPQTITQMLPASQQVAAQLAQISQRIPQLQQITQQQQQQQQVFNQQQPQQTFNQQQQVVNQQQQQQQQQDEQEDLTVAMMTANMSNAAPFEERQVSMTVIKPPAGTTIEEAIQAHAQVDSPPRTVAILSKRRPLETVAHLGGGGGNARGVSTAAAEEAVPVPVEVQLRKAPGTPTIELPEPMGNIDPDGFSSGSDLIYSTSAGDMNSGRYRRSADAPTETLEPSDRIANQPRTPPDAFQLRAASEAREQPTLESSPTDAKDDTIEAAASEDSHDEEEPSDEEMVDTADSNDEAAAAAPVDSEGDEYGASDMADDQDDASAFDGDDEPYNQGASSERDYNSPSFEIPKIDINPAALKQNGCRTVLREVQEIPMNGLGVVQADGRAGSGYQHSTSSSDSNDRAAAGSVPARNQLPGVRVRRHANDNLINSRKVTSIVMTKECHFPNDSSGSSSLSGNAKSQQPSLARQRSVAPVSLESQSPVASDEATQTTSTAAAADKLPVASGQSLSAAQLTHPFGRKFPQKGMADQRPVNDPRFGQSQPDKSLFEPNVAQYPLNSVTQHQLIVNPQFGQQHHQETKLPEMVALGYSAPALHGYHQQPQLAMAASERRPLTLVGNSLVPQSPVLAHPKPQPALQPMQSKQQQAQPQPHIKRRSATPTRADLNAAAATPQMRRREDVVAQKLYKPPSAQDPFHTLSYSSSNGVDPDPDDRDERDESTGSSPSSREDVDRSSAPSTKYSSETLSERERDALLDPNYDDTDPAEPNRRKKRPQNRNNKQRAMSSASNDDESRAPQELDDLDDAADDFAGDESRLTRSRSSPVRNQNEQQLQQQYPMMQTESMQPRNHHHHNQQPAAMRRQSQPLPEEPVRFGKSFRFEHERGRPQARGLMAQLSQLPAQQSFVSESTGHNHHHHQPQVRHNRLPAAKHIHQPAVIERRQEQEDPDERDDDDDEDEPQSVADRPVATTRSKKTIRSQKRLPADEDEPDADPEYNPKEVHLPAHSKPKKIQKSFAYVHRDLPQKGDPKSNDDDFVLSYGRGNLQTEQEDYDSDRDNQHQPNGSADNNDDAQQQQQQQQAASKLQPRHSMPMSTSLPLSTTN